jgi:two-component system, OmpR family, phosphate regulon response regulator PhoB
MLAAIAVPAASPELETEGRIDMDTTYLAGPEPGGRSAEADPGPGSRERPLILAVEDEQEHWEIYGKMLWYNGFEVVRAADGEAGLQLAQELRPDLIMVDIMLPKLDGLELCGRLKGDPETAEIPVVILSGRSRSELGARASDLDCASYLEKPIGPLDVLHEVERLVGRAPPAGDG